MSVKEDGEAVEAKASGAQCEAPAARGPEEAAEVLAGEDADAGTGEGGAAIRPLLWTEGMEGAAAAWTLGQPSASPKAAAAISGFLFVLASAMERRAALLDAAVLTDLAHAVREGRADAVVAEPWMSKVKVGEDAAFRLAAAVMEKLPGLVSAGTMEKLGGIEAAGYDALKVRVAKGDGTAVSSVAEVLRGSRPKPFPDPAPTFDYVLACIGDRAAMDRLHYRLVALVTGRDGAGVHLTKRQRDEMRVLADSWRRLTYGRFLPYGRSLYGDYAGAIQVETMRLVPLETGASLRYFVFDPPSAEARQALRSLKGTQGGGMEEVDASSFCSRTVRVFAGSDDAETAKIVSESFPAFGSEMPMVAAPDPDVLYAALSREFPWMDEANRHAALAAAWSKRAGDGEFRMPAVVLSGPPGSGKSRWASRLSALSGVPAHRVTLSGLASSKSVVGSERGWSGARASLGAYALAGAKVANPLVIVDEADKSAANSHNGDALEGLLPMIDRETAGAYHDVYLLGSLDLSRLGFVLTVNSVSSLPQPLLDRVKVVNVPRPGPKAMPSVAAVIAAEAMAEVGVDDGATGETLRAQALSLLQGGRSMRVTAEAVRAGLAGEFWSPPGRLRLVSDAGTEGESTCLSRDAKREG